MTPSRMERRIKLDKSHVQVPKAADPTVLPKIKLTDNLYDIRAAFEEVQRQVTRN